MIKVVSAVCGRDVKRFLRNRNDVVQPLVFFLLVVTLVALAVGAEATTFRQLAPAVAWVAVVLALTINLSAMFGYDFEDGTIEQLILSAEPLPVLVLAKLMAHWVATALPQILASAIFAFVIGLDPSVTATLLFSLLLGTPVLTAIGSIASALTIGLYANGVLIALIAIPLYLPVLIFGTSAINNAALQLPSAAELYFLGGLSVLAISLSPFACAAALRIRLA